MVIGKPKENKLSCGAERVIIPIATLMSSTTSTTGSIITEAFKNIEPDAAIPPWMSAEGTGRVPIGINS